MASGQSNACNRIKALGIAAAGTLDLIAVGFSRREEDVDANARAANALWDKLGQIDRFQDLAPVDLTEFGLDGFENLRSLALVELGRRAGSAVKGERRLIESERDAVLHLRTRFKNIKKEVFVAVLLDAKNAIMRIADIHMGTLTMSPVGPREVFREAVRDGASAIIVAHNHPSGDPTPSPEDRMVTEKLKQVGDLLDIPLLDHLVIGERYAVSAMTGRRIE